MIQLIKELSIKNFKSVKELDIECKRINLFIGRPNTGKSNILEALGVLSWLGHSSQYDLKLKEFVRFQYTDNIFHDNSTDESIKIAIIIEKPESVYSKLLDSSIETVEATSIRTNIEPRNDIYDLNVFLENSSIGGASLDESGKFTERRGIPYPGFEIIRFYRFKACYDAPKKSFTFLMPPYGSNMFQVVMGSKKLRETMGGFFRDFGFKLMLRTQTQSFEFLKDVEDVVLNYPYILASDTLQRMIFYSIAIESNENSTLIFEEPEAHTFPNYTYEFGKKIALDETNQYFIATHNPYLLLSILEKTPKDDVNVFVTYLQDYQTKVKCLNDEQKSELMIYDPFGNLDLFTGTMDSITMEETE